MTLFWRPLSAISVEPAAEMTVLSSPSFRHGDKANETMTVRLIDDDEDEDEDTQLPVSVFSALRLSAH